MRKKAYDNSFFEEDMRSRKSAETIVPFVISLLSPDSVIDIGCGRGEFLSVFTERGITDVLGVDGEWAGKNNLKIPTEKFFAADLEKPFSLNKKFDLVICLEVAEHLSPGRAASFVDCLTELGDVILFSAAVPGQGGRNHINEKWPSYWASLFSESGYLCIDCLRKKFWDNPDVQFWYSQNMLLYIREEKIDGLPGLRGCPRGAPPALIHPELYLKKCRKRKLF